MKLSECSYCGMLAITDNDVCTSCQSLISPEMPSAAQDTVQPETSEFQPPAQVIATSGYPASNNEYAAQQSPPVRRSFPGSQQTVSDSKCLKCGTPVPRGQRQCFDCANKKSSPWKKLTFLTILIAAIGFFSFDYVYEQVSPYGIFRKYAKTTGADDSVVFENFVLKGDTGVSVSMMANLSGKGLSDRKIPTENFSFKMIFKKPNISSIELTRDGETGPYTAFKQVFDGVRGWKYTNMPNQPAGYQDSDDAFASKKMGMGMDEYDSLEFMNEAIAQEYGNEYIKLLTDITEVEVADIKKPSGEKTIVIGKQKHNGKIESSLLVFDRKTGLLIGMLKKAVMGSTPVMTIIYLDKYAKFPVKRNGLFGVGETRVLVPTKMSFVTSPGISGMVNGIPTITMELNVKSVETDAKIEDNYFQKQ